MLPDSPRIWSISWKVLEGVLYKFLPQPNKALSVKFRLSLCMGNAMFSSSFPVSSSCQHWLAYILYDSWLHSVFHVYTTLKPGSWHICSAYVPSLRLGSARLICTANFLWPQFSDCIYTQNTPCNTDLYITYSAYYLRALIKKLNCHQTVMWSSCSCSRDMCLYLLT